MSSDRNRGRRERTFVGSECSVCEEPLEHTLRGERILQFSCGHVAHEACFYELIKEFESQYCPSCEAPLHLDTSRGGNVIDIGELFLLVILYYCPRTPSVFTKQPVKKKSPIWCGQPPPPMPAHQLRLHRPLPPGMRPMARARPASSQTSAAPPCP